MEVTKYKVFAQNKYTERYCCFSFDLNWERETVLIWPSISLRKQPTFGHATTGFPASCQMTSEKWTQKINTDDASLPRSG